MRLEYPVTDEIPAEQPDYQQQIAAFYRASAEALAALLRDRASRSACWPRAIRSSTAPSCICGAGSRRDFPVEVVPGVTGMSGCWTRANLPMTWGNDTLAVLPGTLAEAQLVERLQLADAAVDHEGRPQPREGAPRRRDARACSRAPSMSSAAPCRTSASCRWPTAASRAGAYFAMVLIPGEGRRL